MAKKYREYTYTYTRFNPQNGDSIRESKVIAFSKTNAVKMAKRKCQEVCYGVNIFNEITGVGPVLEEGKDFRVYSHRVLQQMTGYVREVWEDYAERIYK